MVYNNYYIFLIILFITFFSVELEGANGEVSVITTAQNGQHFVSIDGKRTYMNLFGQDQPATQQNLPIKPTQAG